MQEECLIFLLCRTVTTAKLWAQTPDWTVWVRIRTGTSIIIGASRVPPQTSAQTSTPVRYTQNNEVEFKRAIRKCTIYELWFDDWCIEYIGKYAHSEVETLSIANLMTTLRPKISFSIHAFSQLWLLPYGWTRRLPATYSEMVNSNSHKIQKKIQLYSCIVTFIINVIIKISPYWEDILSGLIIISIECCSYEWQQSVRQPSKQWTDAISKLEISPQSFTSRAAPLQITRTITRAFRTRADLSCVRRRANSMASILRRRRSSRVAVRCTLDFSHTCRTSSESIRTTALDNPRKWNHCSIQTFTICNSGFLFSLVIVDNFLID